MPDWISTSLRSRAVLRIAGPDCLKFLQGLITNDTNRMQQDNPPVLYAAMLNNKGRQLYDMMLHRDTSDSSAVLLDCPAESAPNLKKLLHRYKLRSQVTVDDASEEYSVVCAWQSSSPSPQEADTPQPLAGLPVDPRLSALGLRGAVSKSQEAQLCTLPGATREHGNTADLYVQHRYSLGVAEGTAEVPEGAAIPLEYNLDWLNGVSFEKGCYVGQELVARTHFGGLIRKRLFPVLFDAQDNIEGATSADVFAEGKVKSIGSVRGACGNIGLAHLRIEDALRAQQAQQPLQASISGRQVPCAPQIPFWWPQAETPQS